MKKFAALLALPLLAASVTLFAQQTPEVTSDGIGYLQYLPDGYHGNTNKYPVVISLHGIVERGTSSTDRAAIIRDLPRVANVGLPKYVRQGKKYPFILISPQLKDKYGSWPPSYIIQVLKHVKKTLRIDDRRVYLTGLSLGGYGTWSTAGAYPEVFAAIGPICPGANALSKARDIAQEDVAIWAFHGTGDRIVSYTVTTRMVEAVNAYKPNPLAKVTLFANMGHSVWDKAYNDTDLLNWMLKFRNGSSPPLDDSGGSGGGEEEQEEEEEQNSRPVVKAGADKNVTLPASNVEFQGEATDPDGKIVSLQWTQTGGNKVTLSNATSTHLRVSDLEAGTFTFRLTAKDDDGATAFDEVKLTVQEGSNKQPDVDAGGDQTITLPQNSVTLKGSANDDDGKITSYRWTKVSGPSAQMQGAESPTLTASSLTRGTYVFRLTVKDDKDASASDDVTVVVKDNENKAPVVDAGSDRTIKLPTNSTQLSGTARDDDGEITSWKWDKVAGPGATMQGAGSQTLNLSALQEGTYRFRLTVKDNDGATASDEVSVTVQSADNKAPVVNAGSDHTLKLPANSVRLTGTARDDDGEITSYRWTKVNGGNATLSGAETPNLMVSDLAAGTYVFRLTAHDNDGANASDDVVVRVNEADNKPPVADAGADNTVQLPQDRTQLQGRGQDEDGNIVRYRWTQIGGPAAQLAGQESPLLTVSGLREGTYAFRLTVTDDDDVSASDDVLVHVIKGSNTPPVVSAGPDHRLRLPENSLRIQGSARDEDGAIESYQWTQTSGPPATMRNTNYPALLVSDLVEGTYTFSLTVRDDAGASGSDVVTVSVEGALPISPGRDFAISPLNISPEGQRQVETQPEILRAEPVNDGFGRIRALRIKPHKE